MLEEFLDFVHCSVLKAYLHNAFNVKGIKCASSFTIPKLLLSNNCSILSTVSAPNIILITMVYFNDLAVHTIQYIIKKFNVI